MQLTIHRQLSPNIGQIPNPTDIHWMQVFSEIRAYFSIGGKLYSGDPIVHKPKEDCIFEEPKTLSFNLHQRVGRFVKIQLFWASKWILISEVGFESSKLVFFIAFVSLKFRSCFY